MCDRLPGAGVGGVAAGHDASNRCWNLNAIRASAQTQRMEGRNELHNVRQGVACREAGVQGGVSSRISVLTHAALALHPRQVAPETLLVEVIPVTSWLGLLVMVCRNLCDELEATGQFTRAAPRQRHVTADACVS
jgi:hypothetical protein